MTQARTLVLGGEDLTAALAGQLFAYEDKNPKDGRPGLILAANRLNHGLRESAVNLYARAVAVDPNAAKDPHVLADLLYIAGLPKTSRRAADLIVKAYGHAAVEPTRAALTKARDGGDDEGTKRLGKLLKRLEATPTPS
jgi:hypothetical protein